MRDRIEAQHRANRKPGEQVGFAFPDLIRISQAQGGQRHALYLKQREVVQGINRALASRPDLSRPVRAAHRNGERLIALRRQLLAEHVLVSGDGQAIADDEAGPGEVKLWVAQALEGADRNDRAFDFGDRRRTAVVSTGPNGQRGKP